jgi:hypothetical protein
MQGQYCLRGHGTKPRAYLCSKSKQVCQPCPPVSGLSTSITTSCFIDVNVKDKGVQNVTERRREWVSFRDRRRGSPILKEMQGIDFFRQSV